ncbi:MAG: hypothetical protein LC109_03180 [Bacteroidia bacterium]|nr:hypothetical protein [Bacteroidia bacterium]
MRDPLNGISTSTLANAIVSNFGNPMDIDAVLAVLGQSLIEGAFSFGELIGFMECMNVPGLSNTLANNFSNQGLLHQLIVSNASQEYLLVLAMLNDTDFVKYVAENYSYLVAEAVRKLEGISVEQYLALVKKHYGDGVMGDLLTALGADLQFTKKFVLNEHHLYGSSRLGVKTHKRVLLRKEFSISGFEEDGTYIVDDVTDSFAYVRSTEYFCRVLAQKQYEMVNHLGNVLATVLDRKTGVFDPVEDTLMYYTADVVNATLYYPFGLEMTNYSNPDFSYEFDFNGKATDKESGWQDYGERMYHKGIIRFTSPDPLIVRGRQYPWYSPYQFAGNTPILATDLDGLEPSDPMNDEYFLARLILTTFYDIKHSAYNIALRYCSPTFSPFKWEAGYKTDANGNQIFETEFREILKDPPHIEAAGFVLDAVNVFTAGKVTPTDFIATKSNTVVTQTTKAFKSAIIHKSTAVTKNTNLQGEWVEVARTEKGIAYQSYLSGQKYHNGKIREFKYNGVDFDGYSNGILFDAKDGYGSWFTASGKMEGWAISSGAADKMVLEANRQITAAGGNKLQWIFSDRTAGENMRNFLKEAGVEVDKIEFKYVEKPPASPSN